MTDRELIMAIADCLIDHAYPEHDCPLKEIADLLNGTGWISIDREASTWTMREPKMPEKFTRINITIPPDLKRRMENVLVNVNWSAVAAEAFERKILEIGLKEPNDGRSEDS